MYTKFFGLKEKPFNLTPDPRFLYLGKNHKESYAQLLYSVKEYVGFVVLIGEVGTGKTTICRSFLNQLPSSCNLAYIFNPNLDDLELLKGLNKELGIEYRYATKKALQDVLYNHLLEQKKNGTRVIMLIDEAQNLSPSVLEQIRLLSNLETETQKLIQIILVGQPELDAMLENESLRQLRQRVSVWCRLYPLDQRETNDYINYRLSIAGGGHLDIFSQRVLKEIYRFSNGTPRLINLLCDRALLAAYAVSERQVSLKTIRKCIREVTGKSPQSGLLSRLTSALAVLVSIAAFGLLISSGAFSGVFNAEAKGVGKQPVPTAKKVTPTPPVVSAPAAVPAISQNPGSPAVSVLYGTEGRNAAVNSAFTAWEANPIAADEASLTLDKIAKARKLECLVGQMDMAQLKALNYPAVLEVSDDKGKTGFLAVMSLTGDTFHTGANGPTVNKEWIEKHWKGKAYIFWKDFMGGSELLKKGDHGPAVEWLQSSMLKLGYVGDPKGVTGVYGDKTAKAVLRFQAENQMPPDGQAGAVTRMFIFNLLPEYKVPRLS